MKLKELEPLLIKEVPIEIVHDGYEDAGVYSSVDYISESLMNGEVIEVYAVNRYEDEYDCGLDMFEPILCVAIKG